MAKPRRELWQLSRRLKHKANDIEREIHERNQTEFRNLIGAESKRFGSLDLRTTIYFANVEAMADRLQSREGR